jgi:hypothetical protein
VEKLPANAESSAAYYEPVYHHPDTDLIFVSSNLPKDGKQIGVPKTGKFWHADYQFPVGTIELLIGGLDDLDVRDPEVLTAGVRTPNKSVGKYRWVSTPFGLTGSRRRLSS